MCIRPLQVRFSDRSVSLFLVIKWWLQKWSSFEHLAKLTLPDSKHTTPTNTSFTKTVMSLNCFDMQLQTPFKAKSSGKDGDLLTNIAEDVRGKQASFIQMSRTPHIFSNRVQGLQKESGQFEACKRFSRGMIFLNNVRFTSSIPSYCDETPSKVN